MKKSTFVGSISVVISFLIVFTNLLGAENAIAEEEFQLEQLLLPKDRLPPNTKVAAVPEGEELPFEMKSNPYISKEREFIEQFSKEMFEGSVEPENITEALFVVYKEKDEIGVCAFRFKDQKLAEMAELNVPEGLFHIRKEKILVVVWHDGVSESVLDTFQQFIKTSLHKDKDSS